jgi:hypothetical protein
MNGAEMDPIEPGELYNVWQSYINQEIQGEYIDPEWSHEIDEDIQLTLPFNEKSVYEGLGHAITPYRWASYLEDAVQQLCMGNDYYTGRAERCDMAEQILNDRLERAATKLEKASLYEAMQVWYRSYGR